MPQQIDFMTIFTESDSKDCPKRQYDNYKCPYLPPRKLWPEESEAHKNVAMRTPESVHEVCKNCLMRFIVEGSANQSHSLQFLSILKNKKIKIKNSGRHMKIHIRPRTYFFEILVISLVFSVLVALTFKFCDQIFVVLQQVPLIIAGFLGALGLFVGMLILFDYRED